MSLARSTDFTARPYTAPGRLLSAAEPVLRRLNGYCKLTSGEAELLRSLAQRVERHAPGAVLHDGDGQPQPRLVLAGWGCRSRVLPDGRRQVLNLVLPGDVLGVPPAPECLASATITALTRVETADATLVASAVGEQLPMYAGLARALKLAAERDLRGLTDQVVRLGRLTAYERTAHWLLEIRDRLAEAGIGDGDTIPLPVTQETMADALGLSIVHVNRTLQQMRRDELIDLRNGRLTLLDAEKMAELCAYAPA